MPLTESTGEPNIRSKSENTLGYIRTLYAQESDVSGEMQRIETMRNQLPEKTRELFDHFTSAHEERLQQNERLTENGRKRMVVRLKMETLAGVLEEHYIDWTLTTSGYPIYSEPHGRSLFKRFIRSSMQREQSTEHFNRVGIAFFDGNGIKSMSVCVGYEEVSKYLKAVARIFSDTQGPTRQQLEKEGIVVTPMAVGGG